MPAIARALTAVVLLAGSLMCRAVPVSADATGDTINQLQGQASAEAGGLAQLWQLESSVADLDGRVACANQALAALQPAVDRARQQAAAAEHDVEVDRFRMDIAQAELAGARDALHRFSVEAYLSPPVGSGLTAWLAGGVSVGSMMARPEYLRSVSQTRGDAILQYQHLQAELADTDAALQSARRTADRALSEVASRQAALTAQASALTSLQAQAAAQQQAVRQQILLFQTSRAMLSQAVGQQGAPDGVTDLVRQREGPAPTNWSAPDPAGLTLVLPVGNAAITSPFGPRINPITNAVEFHPGVDFAAADLSPIHAALGGRVIWAGPLGGYGNATLIDAGDLVTDLYGHQAQIMVQPGDVVTAGQVIGLEGSTGESTGPHVHFEVRVQGVVQDPFPYLLNALIAAPAMVPAPAPVCPSG